MKLLKWKSKDGSILLEALLSTVILAVSLTLIIQSMIASYRATVYVAQYTKAIFYIENKLSELRLKGTIGAGVDLKGEFSDQKYQYDLTTSHSGALSAPNLSEINLAVAWQSGKRKNNIEVKTYLFEGSNEE